MVFFGGGREELWLRLVRGEPPLFLACYEIIDDSCFHNLRCFCFARIRPEECLGNNASRNP